MSEETKKLLKDLLKKRQEADSLSEYSDIDKKIKNIKGVKELIKGKRLGKGSTENIKTQEIVAKIKNGNKIQKNRQVKTNQGTEKIGNTKTQKVISGEEFTKKISEKRKAHALKTAAKRGLLKTSKKGLKALPLIGGIATAIMNKDVSAAIPLLGSSDEVGRGSDKPPKMTAEKKAQVIKTMKEQSKKPVKKPKTLKSVARDILGLK